MRMHRQGDLALVKLLLHNTSELRLEEAAIRVVDVRSDAGGSLLFPQTWSPIIDISTWFPQLEHFIVGMKADCRDRSVMIVTVIPNPLVCVVLPNTHSFVVGCQSIKL